MDGYHGLWVGILAPSTMFYSEYQNYGPGSSTKNKVKGKGVETINLQVASKFTVNKFVQKGTSGFRPQVHPTNLASPDLSVSLFLFWRGGE